MDGQNLQQLQEKWAPILNHESFSDISDSHKRGVVAQLLENQEKESQETASFLGEAAPTNSGHAPAGANVAGFDPVLISLIRRSMPNLIAYDICGVQREWSYWTYLRNALRQDSSDWNRDLLR